MKQQIEALIKEAEERIALHRDKEVEFEDKKRFIAESNYRGRIAEGLFFLSRLKEMVK